MACSWPSRRGWGFSGDPNLPRVWWGCSSAVNSRTLVRSTTRRTSMSIRSDATVHTNTIENVFSVFKRGMIGTYQHCGEAHLHRYLAEFDFRYNRRAALKVSDAERAEDLLRMARDKRLTYRRTGEAGHA